MNLMFESRDHPGVGVLAHAGAFLSPTKLRHVRWATSRGVALFLADRLKSISQLPD